MCEPPHFIKKKIAKCKRYSFWQKEYDWLGPDTIPTIIAGLALLGLALWWYFTK